jgi:4-aminobutyrate aminotransferase-like enzyme
MRPPKPVVSPDLAERWALDRFGIRATAAELPGEIDRNFRLSAEDGSLFVMKIAPGATDSGSISCQLAALQHLQKTDLRDLLPGIVADRDGEPVSRLQGQGDEPLFVRVLTYLEGTPLDELDETTPDLRRQIGRGLGKLDGALASFDHPGAHRPLVWDLARVLDLGVLSDHLDPGIRTLVLGGLETFASRIQPRLGELRTSVIHNDANSHNLLVRDNGKRQPVLAGLIDFGDMIHTMTVAEPAIACAYAMLGAEDPVAVAADVIAGYEAEFPLHDLERLLLPDLIIARLCASLLLSAQARAHSPDNDYLTVSERPVADLLRRLSTMSDHTTFHAAPPGSGRTPEEIVEVRRRHLGRNLSLAYERPLKIVRGQGQYLYDESGRRFLDLVNNVCHVGHCHPRVVEAGQRQMGLLNTNSRYVHDHLAAYVLRLTATMPETLSVCFLVCTGTEANDLALRLARSHTGSREIIVLDHAYHGHSSSLVEISPYKCEGPGGQGLAEHAHKVPCPDVYRGSHRGEDAAERYINEVAKAIEKIQLAGKRPGAFMAETLVGCGGQIVPPPGFLQGAFAAARHAGAVCIADEVQVGFGRVGSHMWAFEAQGVAPDIVTLGKPIGNGHPLAAVVTTPEIAASFDTGMEYFNTFGGNPVSCAIGLAVLDVIEQEGLQKHALKMGERFGAGLTELSTRHELVGDVRGQGLFLGLELVRDRKRLEPAASEAAELIERMKDRGFLLSTDGPDHNVIKIKPPMVLTTRDVDATIEAFDNVLGTLQ